MRLRYSTTDPSQNEFDSLPRIPLILRKENRVVEALGLVDSGATVSVLPYEIGIQLASQCSLDSWADKLFLGIRCLFLPFHTGV